MTSTLTLDVLTTFIYPLKTSNLLGTTSISHRVFSVFFDCVVTVSFGDLVRDGAHKQNIQLLPQTLIIFKMNVQTLTNATELEMRIKVANFI